MLDRLIQIILQQRLLVILGTLLVVVAGFLAWNNRAHRRISRT